MQELYSRAHLVHPDDARFRFHPTQIRMRHLAGILRRLQAQESLGQGSSNGLFAPTTRSLDEKPVREALEDGV